MATVLVSSGSSADSSSDVTVEEPITLFIRGASGAFPRGAEYKIEAKGADNGYQQVGTLRADSVDAMSTILAAPGTWRFTRIANGVTSSLEQG